MKVRNPWRFRWFRMCAYVSRWAITGPLTSAALIVAFAVVFQWIGSGSPRAAGIDWYVHVCFGAFGVSMLLGAKRYRRTFWLAVAKAQSPLLGWASAADRLSIAVVKDADGRPEISVSLTYPSDATAEEIAAIDQDVERFVKKLDGIHRKMGGSGLKVLSWEKNDGGGA